MIKSIKDLEAVREKYRPSIQLRLGHAPQQPQTHVLVCSGTACTSSASLAVREELLHQLQKHHLEERVKVIKTGCFGFCQRGPIVVVQPDNVFYCQVERKDVIKLVEKHLMGGQVIEELLFQEPDTGDRHQKMADIRFFHNQQRVLLHNCGLINPEDINEYIARDGYFALAGTLHQPPAEVIAQVLKSGLRGRGGGGFPTGRKWNIASQQKVTPKYVVCNADEGDPGAFMDRSILEGDPHAVLEGMSIAAYAIGAAQGYIYVRAEYPIAVDRLEVAIRQAREAGLLGQHILGTDFSFDIGLKLGAGAFVCGEETALLHSAMGARGEPRPRPPYPAQEGLWGKPTIINNVETLANVPLIFRKGWEWYTGQGVATSTGTKVFSLAGKINNTGLIEVPMGTSLRTIIFDIGGGIQGGHQFKAVQTGGPSGGCIPEEHLDRPVDYDSLKEIGSMMGSGGLIVMDDRDCMVDIARFYIEFAQDESCGRCTACRVGTKRLLEILQRITKGQSEMEDLELMEELAYDIRDASLCGLGQTAPNPVLSTLRYFREEYLAHIRDKHCPAGVCKDLLHYQVVEDKCIGCGLCAKACGVDAITGEKKEPHRINPEKCVRCGACQAKCPKAAIIRGGRRVPAAAAVQEGVIEHAHSTGIYTGA